MSNNNDLKELMESIDDVTLADETVDASLLPNRCLACLNNPICHGLTTTLSLVKIGIKVQVERCRYYRKAVVDQ